MIPMLDVGATELLKEGGFAFAALLMASLVYLSWRQNAKYMNERGTWVDRLLTRLEATDQEHKAHAEHLTRITESLHEVVTTLTRLNGRKG